MIIMGASSLTATQQRFNAPIVCGQEFNHVLWLWSLRATKTRQRTYVTDLIVPQVRGPKSFHLRFGGWHSFSPSAAVL